MDYELTLSIKDQFDAFADGFKRVCNTQCEIYVSLVCTSPDSYTVYVNKKVTIQYSNDSVVSFPHYSSSTVLLTVIDY